MSRKASCLDGGVGERIKTLGGMASDTNQERSLHRWLRNLFGHSLNPYNVVFKLQKDTRHGVEEIQIPTIPLWMLLSALYNAGELQFEVSMLGKGGDLAAQSFWECALTQEWGRAHPALQGNSGPKHLHILTVRGALVV